MFDFLLTNQNSSFLVIVVNILLAFSLSLIIASVYQKTHKGLSYSQSFVLCLVFLCPLASVIMMVIGNTLITAIALLGAFTIIRFRTAIKDPKDVSFILFSLIVGMGIGTGGYLIAATSVFMICLAMYFLHRINFGSMQKQDYTLTFSLDKEKTPSDVYESIFKQYLKTVDLLNINTREQGKMMDLTFTLRFLSGARVDRFVEELSAVSGLENVNLIMTRNDIEY
ncbi:MAG: DUF4956 domain-containing protein [bacterium]